MQKNVIFLFSLLILGAATVGWVLHVHSRNTGNQNQPISAVLNTTSNTPTTTLLQSAESTPVSTQISLPKQLQLSVPYTLQAPFNKWDALHEDACEETSLIMIKHFQEHTQISSPVQADREITDLIIWEQQHGYGPSITLEQLNQIARDYYGMNNGDVVQLNSIDQVKQEIVDNHPVILGMAGKILPNPYFSKGGPNYHMLVATGYDTTGIVTNEPGTWHGDGFHYDYQSFYSAIHDWDADNILNGQKRYLVFK